MRTATLEKKEDAGAPKRSPSAPVHGLVRRLIEHLGKRLADRGPSLHERNDIMLDVQVDGIRCLLVRLSEAPLRAPIVLSPREREIARMVAKGFPNKTIAGVLELSSWTVGTYLRRIFAKLGVGSRAAMVARLMEEGLLGS